MGMVVVDWWWEPIARGRAEDGQTDRDGVLLSVTL